MWPVEPVMVLRSGPTRAEILPEEGEISRVKLRTDELERRKAERNWTGERTGWKCYKRKSDRGMED